MKRKAIRRTRYIIAVLSAVLIGLVITKAVTASAETDRFLEDTDAFIARMEAKNEGTADHTYSTAAVADYSSMVCRETQLTETESFADLDPDFFEQINGNYLTPEEFREAGVLFWGMWKFTWYSEYVLPGDGLDIPGRWSDGDFVRDCDGYICVATNDLDMGTVVQTPWGDAKVYDRIGDGVVGGIDIYVSW